ncbi:phosphatidylinositol:udp-c transferase pig-c [Grosmannia clavigera kw1407]|uniref:Phosphatidylinositol:udp-c transferase pig-c n=1 Tax=Grosmannia clavigera (strain kw1407 / UAMH 11150) TaxID=655863 RepID=F0XGG7_GROCL|nr:phosphatidylinositol:udp-c transferase pig-c [Grosmannia clavigera kw1407]EFX02760.1 phosphatidylinositol:udp-c transferase pig-c [Grosmannia clavigera kw1407]
MASNSNPPYAPSGQQHVPSQTQTSLNAQHTVPLLSELDDPFPPLTENSALPEPISYASIEVKTTRGNPVTQRVDPYHLAPEDAFYTSASPPRHTNNCTTGPGSELPDSRPSRQSPRLASVVGGGGIARATSGVGSRSRSRRRRKRTWKKLLWVKQSCTTDIFYSCTLLLETRLTSADPDNYTDQATFLENLQRNPRLQPYDFWPLVADSTVIVQHVCSVIIFIVCFVGIFQERVSPVSVVGGGSFATCLGWLLWERWASDEDPDAETENALRLAGDSGPSGEHMQQSRAPRGADVLASRQQQVATSLSRSTIGLAMPHSHKNGLTNGNGHVGGNGSPSWQPLSQSTPALSLVSAASEAVNGHGRRPEQTPAFPPPRRTLAPMRRGRTRRRVAAIKSGMLIYFTLLGLSPILKSLTRSTSSDSIWAMSFWLLAINIFFFDYSGAWVGAHKFPVASLSTNAALMASTVLASRLPSTGQVFSLTLFSIEVFGLFPVFRRYARHRSWRYHVSLTVLLVLGAGAGVGIIIATGGNKGWPWRRALAGMTVACVLSAVAMGGCSWWLIGLQKYKNEIYGPWDPARPVIISRRHWNDV